MWQISPLCPAYTNYLGHYYSKIIRTYTIYMKSVNKTKTIHTYTMLYYPKNNGACYYCPKDHPSIMSAVRLIILIILLPLFFI